MAVREIKFSGKCLRSGDWVEGDLIHGVGGKYGNMYILPRKINLAYVKHCDPLDGVKVDPSTVVQLRYTNKEGVEYYDGDRYHHAGYGVETVRDICELQIALYSGNTDDIGKIIGNIHEGS